MLRPGRRGRERWEGGRGARNDEKINVISLIKNSFTGLQESKKKNNYNAEMKRESDFVWKIYSEREKKKNTATFLNFMAAGR